MCVSSNSYYYLLYVYTRALYRNKRLLTVRGTETLWSFDCSVARIFFVSFLTNDPQHRLPQEAASTPRKDSGDLRSAVSLALHDVWRENVRLRNERGRSSFTLICARTYKIMYYPGYVSDARYDIAPYSVCTPARTFQFIVNKYDNKQAGSSTRLFSAIWSRRN